MLAGFEGGTRGSVGVPPPAGALGWGQGQPQRPLPGPPPLPTLRAAALGRSRDAGTADLLCSTHQHPASHRLLLAPLWPLQDESGAAGTAGQGYSGGGLTSAGQCFSLFSARKSCVYVCVQIHILIL